MIQTPKGTETQRHTSSVNHVFSTSFISSSFFLFLPSFFFPIFLLFLIVSSLLSLLFYFYSLSTFYLTLCKLHNGCPKNTSLCPKKGGWGLSHSLSVIIETDCERWWSRVGTYIQMGDETDLRTNRISPHSTAQMKQKKVIGKNKKNLAQANWSYKHTREREPQTIWCPWTTSSYVVLFR